jgi:hypothetical protein
VPAIFSLIGSILGTNDHSAILMNICYDVEDIVAISTMMKNWIAEPT